MQTRQRVSFADFILLHEGDDPVRLLLSRDKLRDLHPDLDIDLAVTTLEVRRKLKNKVPEWYSVPSLIYPFRLSGEQCSSSETAKYKALLASGLRSEGIPPETVASRPLPPQAAGPSLLCGRGWPQVFRQTPSVLYNNVFQSVHQGRVVRFFDPDVVAGVAEHLTVLD